MPISCIILAGGLATRMGGVDKGLIQLRNKPLVQHVIARMQPQVDEILINANRELAQYQTMGYRVLQDEIAGFAGPLAGISLGLRHAQHEYVLTVPCDSPILPTDLVARLEHALVTHDAEVTVASSDGDAHPVISLCRKSALPSLLSFMALGGSKVSAWQKSLRYAEVDFSDQSAAFTNLNTLADLQALESELGG